MVFGARFRRVHTGGGRVVLAERLGEPTVNYELNRLLFDLGRDTALASRFKLFPQEVVAGRSLDDAERSALVSVDVSALARLGAHPLLLMQLAGISGISMDELARALTAATQLSR